MAFNYTTSMSIGETTRSIPIPVMYDTHCGIFNNKPPGTLITGSPGTGKTFLALTLTSISAVLGKITIVIDPKGDFASLFNLEDELGDITLWNLSSTTNKKKGFLDPFYLADSPGEKLDLVMTVIGMFIGGLSDEQTTVLAPIVKDMISDPVPSLLKVVMKLNTSNSVVARNLGTHLDMISKLPYSEVCFAPGNKRQNNLRIDKGTTIITMPGLELQPADQSGSSSNNKFLSNRKRLSSTVFYLVTDYIRRVMNNDGSTRPKTLIIDEAWAVIQTEEGAQCVKEVALLGRSKKLALILISQTNKSLKHLDIENTISTRFAFATDQNEAAEIVKSMRLPENEDFESILTDLDNGECLMKDWLGRYCTIKIDNSDKKWVNAFETNPLKRDKQKKARSENNTI